MTYDNRPCETCTQLSGVIQEIIKDLKEVIEEIRPATQEELTNMIQTIIDDYGDA